MDLTADEVDTIHATKEIVGDLLDYAEDNPDSPLDVANLVLLEEQLDALHQGLALAVAQKQQMGDDGE